MNIICNNELSCMYLNARSLINKMHTFEAWVHDVDPDIIGITESWAHSGIFDGELMLPEYDLFRKDRQVDRQGGGVLLYVKSRLNAVEVMPTSKFPEQVWCSITNNKNVKLLIGVVYRTPSDDIYGGGNHELLRELLNDLGNLKRHFMLMGDFNYRFDQWPPLDGIGMNKETKEFVYCVEDNFFTQHVDFHTRTGSILDLVLTEEPDMVKDITEMDVLDTSDHKVLTWKVEIDNCYCNKNRKIYDYVKADYERIRQEIRTVDWNSEFEVNSIEHNWSLFKKRILEVQDKYIPVKKSHNSRKKPIWMSYRALKAVSNRRRVYRKYKGSTHPSMCTGNEDRKKKS